MTPTDRAAFLDCYRLLATTMKEPIVDATVAAYFCVLQPFPLDAVVKAATAIMSEQKWFPKPAEWVAEARRAAVHAWAEARPDPGRDPWQDECGACQDTGWEPLHCAGDGGCGSANCARVTKYPHDYVRACPCRSTNHTYERRHGLAARVAASPQRTGR